MKMDIIIDLKDQVVAYYDDIIALLPKLLVAFVVCFIVLFITRIIRNQSIKFIGRKADDKLLVNFLSSIFKISNIILIALLFLYIVGLGGIASSILGAAGVSAFVIGFALKDIGENFLAGIIMAFDRPFRIGDTIKTGEVEGKITAMSLRDTHIKTFDGKDVYVPNGQLIKNPLYNYTIDGFMRLSFIIGVDYGSNIDEARDIIRKTILKIPGVLTEEKKPSVHVTNLNTSTVDIEVQIWIDTFDKEHSGTEVKSMAQSKCIEALASSSIGMPADIIELKNYDDGLKMAK